MNKERNAKYLLLYYRKSVQLNRNILVKIKSNSLQFSKIKDFKSCTPITQATLKKNHSCIPLEFEVCLPLRQLPVNLQDGKTS